MSFQKLRNSEDRELIYLDKKPVICLLVALCLVIIMAVVYLVFGDEPDGGDSHLISTKPISAIDDDMENSATITVNVPAIAFTGESRPQSGVITDEDRANGFADIRVNPDGSVNYVIYRDAFDSYVSNLKRKTEEKIATLATRSDVKKLEVNEDLTYVLVSVVSNYFDDSVNSDFKTEIFRLAYYYQIFSGKLPESCFVVIKTVDSETTEVLSEYTYPAGVSY